MRLFEVGGHVRDSLLGIESHDIDIAVEASSWDEMREYVLANSKKIFLEKPEYLTIRAQSSDNKIRDYVLCRRESKYSDGRRPDSVELGTILDDLARRDFTTGAISRNLETGEIYDPFNGVKDLERMLLRCVGNPRERFEEDALRFLRAVRFIVTKNFKPHISIFREFQNPYWASKLSSISRDRVREELEKCFKHDTFCAMKYISNNIHDKTASVIFGNDIWLKPTTEKRK